VAISLSFKNFGHAFASFFKAVAKDSKLVGAGAEKVLDEVAAEKTVVEGVSGAVANAVSPGSGTVVVTIEDAAFSVLGAIDAALKSGGDAVAQKLLDAGVDVAAINNAKAVGTQTESFFALLKGAAPAKP
jgi:hypothetical protein